MAKSKSTRKQETKVKVRRDAETGQFVAKKYADTHPKTTVTDTIKKKKPKPF
jgi:hypothetical protein